MINKMRMTIAVIMMGIFSHVQGNEPLVTETNDGLVYGEMSNKDRIPDFSYCGYKGGGIALPSVPVKLTLRPNPSGDDTARIQAALNNVGDSPINSAGSRGAVVLKAGTYRVAETLAITASGVVLRGEGQGQDGTIIIATGNKKRPLIKVNGVDIGNREINSTRTPVAAARVPVGARLLRLASAKGFKKGDRIVVYRPGTANWIKALGTDTLNKGPKDAVKNWEPSSYDFRFEREIVEVMGNKIMIDAPLVLALDTAFGGGAVYKRTDDLRINNVGVEHLRLVSEYALGKETSDESHAWDGITISKAVDCWVRNVTAVHFGYSCVNVKSNSKRITVQDSACVDPVSKISGGRRYSFAMAGQLCLVQRCYTRLGRHDYVMHARVPGPNVFLDCIADNARSDSGPHHRWSTGTLYDNLICGPLNVQWRGRSGTGHGWAGANMVFWNCVASSIHCQKPPTANNYCIGSKGKIRGNGHIESRGVHVNPRSLYIRQLEERLGKTAVLTVTTPAQRDGTIEKELRNTLEPQQKSLYGTKPLKEDRRRK